MISEERASQLKESFGRSKMMDLYGAVITGIDHGYFEIRLEKQDFMARPAGMFNGGVIATLVDTSSGYAAASAKIPGSYFVTVELKVNYLNPAMGEQLIAKASVLKNGKVLTVVRSEIYAIHNGKESHVATSLVTLM